MQRSQFACEILAGLAVIPRREGRIGKNHRPRGELPEHLGAAGTIVGLRHMDELLPDRRGVSIISRGLRAEDAEVDRDQDGAEAIVGPHVMRLGQADEAADFLTEVFANVLFGQMRAELFIIRTGRVVDDIVPPDRLIENFTLGIGKTVHACERGEAVLDMREIVIVAAGAV